MGGDFIGHRRADKGRKTGRQADPNSYYWWALACGSLLVVGAAATVLFKPMASAPVATNVAEAERQDARDMAPLPAAEKSVSETIVRKVEAPKPPPPPIAPAPEERTSQPDMAAPASPEVQTSKPETETVGRQQEAQRPVLVPDIAAPTPQDMPQEQKPPPGAAAVPDVAAPSPEAQPPKLETRPETDTAARQPEEQAPASNPVAPSPDDQTSKPDGAAPAADAQGSKAATETVARQSDGAKSGRKARTDPVVPQLVLPAEVAKKVGQKIWLNETGGNRDAITSWNANEEFASLGIGHFIWFPAGKTAPFEESFPPLLEFLRNDGAHLPSWVDKTPIPPCPWVNRADFMKKFNSPQMKELRRFLLDTVTGQTQFLVARAQGAMGKILDNTPDRAEREHIIEQFSRVVAASRDLYPLIDYINFKGEGTNPAETAPDRQTGTRQGWGLKQVLLKMSGTTSDRQAVLGEFADAAKSVLQQRARNIPANRIFEAGWFNRVATYRRPIVDPESNPKRAGNDALRARAARGR